MSELVLDFTKDNPEKLKEIIELLSAKTRIEILVKISSGKDWAIGQMAKYLNCGFANASQHISRLERGGLIYKKSAKTVGNNVRLVKPVYKSIKIIFRE